MFEQTQQVGRVDLLADAHLDARPLLLEAADQAGEDARADALVDPEAQRPGRTLGERGQVGLGGIELRDDRVRVPEEQPPRVGQVDGPRATGTVDEPLPDIALEQRDLLADGGLGVAELPGRATEGARAADGLEGREMPQFDAEPSITFHNRNKS